MCIVVLTAYSLFTMFCRSSNCIEFFFNYWVSLAVSITVFFGVHVFRLSRNLCHVNISFGG